MDLSPSIEGNTVDPDKFKLIDKENLQSLQFKYSLAQHLADAVHDLVVRSYDIRTRFPKAILKILLRPLLAHNRHSLHLSSLAMQVVIQGGAKLRHIRSHYKGLQGLTCIEMLIKCRLVSLI